MDSTSHPEIFPLPAGMPCGTHDTPEVDARATSLHMMPPPRHAKTQCCLVQIFPADVVRGMIAMTADRIVVGRDELCEVSLCDQSVSRRHAEFIREANGYRLLDLGSTNGTFINDEPASGNVLRSGDTIRFGRLVFRFSSAGSVESHYHETIYAALVQDALTGTMNKRYLLESLRREYARAVRQRRHLSVVMMDIDYFKQVNDSYGHLVGDEVLREFGNRMLSASRQGDLLARYGGEEFCLLLAETDPEKALQITRRCHDVTSRTPFMTTAGPLSITASFGVASINFDHATDPEQLLAAADRALYRAKEDGRNRIVTYREELRRP